MEAKPAIQAWDNPATSDARPQYPFRLPDGSLNVSRVAKLGPRYAPRYFYRLKARETFREIKRMVLLK